MRDILAALEHVLGRPLATIPAPVRVHPEQAEADARRIERAERDREFRRVYGDGR